MIRIPDERRAVPVDRGDLALEIGALHGYAVNGDIVAQQRVEHLVEGKLVELLSAVHPIGNKNNNPPAAARAVVEELRGGEDGVIESFGGLTLDDLRGPVDR